MYILEITSYLMAGLITCCHLKWFFLTKGISVRGVGCVIKYYRQGSILSTGFRNKVVFNFPFLPQLILPKMIKKDTICSFRNPEELLLQWLCWWRLEFSVADPSLHGSSMNPNSWGQQLILLPTNELAAVQSPKWLLCTRPLPSS